MQTTLLKPSPDQLPVRATETGSRPFSADEWAALRREDYRAAVGIVCIMGGLFTLARASYTAICFWVAWGS